MRSNPITPEYGPLHGLRVMLTGVAFAGPFAARWLGDMGAEIIKIEIPGSGDTSRIGRRTETGVVPKWISLGRNMNSFEFNMNFDKVPESKEVFVDLVKQCDIWINSVPNIGKHGPTDELAMSANPKLVIVHVTGYGLKQNGGVDPLPRQALRRSRGPGLQRPCRHAGHARRPLPHRQPPVCDITTALFAACGSLAGYYSMLQTGKGQVIDASMYESAAYLMSYHWCEQLNGGGNYKRTGPLNPLWRPFGYYECRDGKWVSVGVWGIGIWEEVLRPHGRLPRRLPLHGHLRPGQPRARKEDGRPLARLAQPARRRRGRAHLHGDRHPRLHAEHRRGRLCQPALAGPQRLHQDNRRHHRGEFVDIATMPRFGGTPCNVYKGAPLLGQESDAIMKEILGYSAEKIESLKAAGAVAASLTTK